MQPSVSPALLSLCHLLTCLMLRVTGPSHTTANTGALLGPTLARRRCLRARGWTMASVGHEAWAAAKTEEERKQLLRRLVVGAGA